MLRPVQLRLSAKPAPAVGRVEARNGQAINVQSRIDDAYWSLAMTLAWIAYRTERAVMNIRSGRWAPNQGGIWRAAVHSALGQVSCPWNV